MFFVVLAAVLGPLFLLCYLIDRRSHSTSVNASRAGEARSDARAINKVPNASGNISWTDTRRRSG